MVNMINMVGTQLIAKPVEHKWKQFKFNLRLSDEDERNQKPGTLTASREVGWAGKTYISSSLQYPNQLREIAEKRARKSVSETHFIPGVIPGLVLIAFRVNLKTLVLIAASFASSLMTLSELLFFFFFFPFFTPSSSSSSSTIACTIDTNSARPLPCWINAGI